MRRLWPAATIVVAVLVVVLLVFLSFGAQGTGTPQTVDDAETVKGSVEVIDGREYDCFRYTEVNRGGLWCERIDR